LYYPRAISALLVVDAVHIGVGCSIDGINTIVDILNQHVLSGAYMSTVNGET
jgi:hypothetical protein